MMSTISEKAGLSKSYINHSFRAISVHVLDSANILSRHIKSVSGLRSENKTYTG